VFLSGPGIAFISILFCLGGAEVALRYSGLYQNYGEKTMGSYSKFWGYKHNQIHRRTPNTTLVYNGPEFTMEIAANSLGFRDIEHPVEKEPGEFRILSLGDSFGEGAGADFEQTWFRRLEAHLKEKLPDRKIRVMSGSIAGNDPVYAYYALEQLFLPYKPDLVIVTSNETDYNEVGARGGLERFSPDAVSPYPQAERREEIYRYSFLARAFMHEVLGYSWLMLDTEEADQMYHKGIDTIGNLMGDFANLGQANGFRVLLVLHPGLTDMVTNDRTIYLEEKAQGKVDILNLTPEFLKQIDATGRSRNDAVWNYLWRSDNHYNPKGYDLWGVTVADYLVKAGYLTAQ
jgi:lysophospholipase L1-like esterase